ncbi:MAG: F0F1 ATP synthase subunit gamma [Candidatus Cloacimonetes bacterium]|nr:F0F1 ATP synthase subunit gamma [Candidatus Cloacimonadota bacterium]
MPIIKGEKKAFHSVREYEFCGMWKDRDEMIKELTLDYHRKRQDNITKEIIEVSSASEAL